MTSSPQRKRHRTTPPSQSPPKLSTENNNVVDEKLYSRQLYVMGHEAQRRMMSSSCLMIGVSGLGVEIAKNVILAGISGLTLYDPYDVNFYDLGGNFYCSESDIGKNRSIVCKDKLAELNRYVKVESLDCEISVEDMDWSTVLKDFSCVVISIPLPLKTLYTLNDICRANECGFIYTHTCSVFGQIFCDFGDKFVVTDKDGENPVSCQVEQILCTNPAAVKVLEDHGRHGLETGDCVTFDRVNGLENFLEMKKEYEIKVTGIYTFELVGCDFSAAMEAATQGYITQVKKPVEVSFKCLKDSVENVDDERFMLVDFAKMERPKQLHYSFLSLLEYTEKHGLPNPGDADAAEAVYSLAAGKSDIFKDDDKTKDMIYHLASGSKTVLSPMCAALGGMVGQEVLKACSGKFMPIRQFLYLDAQEALPKNIPSPPTEKPTRYLSQIAVFGPALQEKICKLNYFLVGAGAIGCEMLKNWALMGVGCGGGKIYITDMDRIEKSNLSRQFLFRNSDIDTFKSATGSKAAKAMNPSMDITPYQEKVGPETENIFGDSFYSSLDGICTALDNVEARLYVDSKCLFYRLPMLESGTLGTKGNTQIVVPHLTENYGATRDPPEKSIPVCTLKNFPNQIQHTLQWARDYFEGVFKQTAEDCNAFLDNKTDYEQSILSAQSNANTKMDTVRSIVETLTGEPKTLEDCVSWSRLLFEQLFSNQIKQLLHNFPEDQVTSTGGKFWSGSKRCPKPVTFDLDHQCEEAQMKNHSNFIVAASNLRATMFGIEGSVTDETLPSILQKIVVPDFKPKEGVKIAANDAENKQMDEAMGDDYESECTNLLKSIPPTTATSLTPIEFDKDIDEHMLFVTACSNLRALNYSIPTEDTHRSRAIAGRIIPAIATTTAMVTGLICLELYKLVSEEEKIVDDYKSGFCNLAIPFMTLSEPPAPAKTKAVVKGKDWNWTAWDSLDIDKGDITLKEFMGHFKEEYNLDVTMLCQGVSILYSFFANKKKVEERMKMTMSEVVRTVSKKELPENQNYIVFEIIANDFDTDEEVEVPYVKFKYR